MKSRIAEVNAENPFTMIFFEGDDRFVIPNEIGFGVFLKDTEYVVQCETMAEVKRFLASETPGVYELFDQAVGRFAMKKTKAAFDTMNAIGREAYGASYPFVQRRVVNELSHQASPI